MSQNQKTTMQSIGMTYIMSPGVINTLPEQLQKDLNAGKKEAQYKKIYMCKNVELSGEQQLIKDSDVKKVGVTNLLNGKLADGEVFVALAVGMAYGFHASVTDPVQIKTYSNDYLNTVPVNVLNSVTTFKTGDRTIIEVPTVELFSGSQSEFGIRANTENSLELPSPKLMLSEKPVRVMTEFPELASPAGKHFLAPFIIGVVFVDRLGK